MSLFLLITISILGSLTVTNAGCVDPGYIPCLPDGSQLGGVPTDSFDDSGFWDNLQSVAGDPIIGRRDLTHRLAARQDALCCSPSDDVECLVTTDDNIPFCYDTQTTLYTFSDNSFGFISNGTYYAADGTFVDFDKGYYSSTDGTEGTFAPATTTGAAATTVQTDVVSTVTHGTAAKPTASSNVVTTTASPQHTTTASPQLTTTAPSQPTTKQTNLGSSAAAALRLGRDGLTSVILGLVTSVCGISIFL